MPTRCASLALHVRTFRAPIIVAALLACGDSSSNPIAPPGGVAQISITPSAPTVTMGAQLTLQAQVRDGSGSLITSASVFWSSADTNVVTVSSTGVVTGKSVGGTEIAASSGGQSAKVSITVVPAPVATVTLTPGNASLVVGTAMTITAILKDANGRALTGRTVTWTSKIPGVATVDANGVVTAASAGSTTITGTSEGKSATATITVSLVPVASVATNPTSASLFVGGTTTISAVAKDANGNILSGRVVAWTSSAPLVATVSANGVVTAITAGTTTITATSEGVTSSGATVVVALVPVATVTVSPSTPALTVGQTLTLTATVEDANGNPLTGRPVTWGSLSTSVATVNATTGLITAVGAGTAIITATSEGKTGNATLTVTPAPVATVSLAPTSASLQVPATVTIVATTRDANGNTLTGRTITWSSSAQSVATVAATGVVSSVDRGSATITATSEGKSASMTVTVTNPVATVVVSPVSPSIAVYQTITLSATTKNGAGTTLTGRTVTWQSSDPSVATVGPNSGLVTAVKAGAATITATSEGKNGTASVTVTPAPVVSVVVSPPSATVQIGATTTFSAATLDAHSNDLGRPVTWQSSDPSIATVDGSGVVTAIAVGSVTITATSETKSGTASVTVIPVPVASVVVQPGSQTLSISFNAAVQLSASPFDSNNNPLSGRTIVWSSTDATIATVDASGLVSAVAPGTVTIKATCDGIVGTATITVTP